MGIRRVVTGHDANGKAVFASDEEVEPITLALLPGTEFYRLWGADKPRQFPDDGSAQVIRLSRMVLAISGGTHTRNRA